MQSPVTSLLALLVVASLLGCSLDTAADRADADFDTPSVALASTNGRVGAHGMVVFGSGSTVYFSHIPMFASPHDVQLVFEGTLSGPPGTALPTTFADRLYTFQPARFSLDALRSGSLRTITGTLFTGNFEDGGRPLARSIRVTARRVLLNHVLKIQDPVAPALHYFAVGTPDQAFLVHLLGGPPSFDQVLVARSLGGPTATALRAGTTVIFPQTQNTVQARLLGGDSSGSFTAVRELSCLVGPDFTGACL